MSLNKLASSRSSGRSDIPSSTTSPSHGWKDRLLAWLPLYMVLGFLALGWILFGDLIAPARSVSVAPVVIQRADAGNGAGAHQTSAGSSDTNEAGLPAEVVDLFSGGRLFQASGWIEAAPQPTRATALVEGVVAAVYVLEGQNVSKGEIIATLIADEARIGLAQARARLAGDEAEAGRERALVARIEAEIETHGLEVAALEARLKELQDDDARLSAGRKGIFSEREVELARLRVKTWEAQIAALQARQFELQAGLQVQMLAAEAARERRLAAETAVQRAQLDLTRTEIRSPIDGVIQQLFVSPGTKRQLQSDDPESATVAILYDPNQLQARIDVPLEEAARVFIGQAVIIRSNLLEGREFRGRVTRIAGMADLQRNTLQAKVSLEKPDPLLRPQVLCRAEFLSAAGGAASGRSVDNLQAGSVDGAGRIVIFVPEAALFNRNGNRAEVWTLDPLGERAVRRAIQLGGHAREGYISVSEGLHPGDPVILDPPSDLTAGERIRKNNL